MKRFLLLSLVWLCVYNVTASAQVVIVFNAELYGRSVDGIGRAMLNNLYGQPVDGMLQVQVKELRSKQTVIRVSTPRFTINRGQSLLPPQAWANAIIQNGSSSYARIAQQTRNFPPGLYEFCFEFIPDDKSLEPGLSCSEAELQPLIPLQLMDPADRDRVCLTRPLLTWQAPIPVSPSTTYRVILVEKTGHSALESILVNRPLLALDNVNSTILPFPSSAPALEIGKSYCWQVFAVESGTILFKSEVWEFTVGCDEEAPPVNKDAYRELKSISNGNFYLAENYIKFSYHNRYNSKQLKYEIFDFNTDGSKVKRTPEVPLAPGLNMVDLDVSDMDLVPGKLYQLKVFPFNEPVILIQFKYISK